MTADAEVIERQIAEWRDVRRPRQGHRGPRRRGTRGTSAGSDRGAHRLGLDADEAFLVAVKRIGSLNALSREFAREHSGRLWRQLVLGADDADGKPLRTRTACRPGSCRSGRRGDQDPGALRSPFEEGTQDFYARNLGFFVLPLLTAYLAWKRNLGAMGFVRLLIPFAAAL